MNRRQFLKNSAALAAGTSLAGLGGCATTPVADQEWFQISLAEWSLHVAIRNEKSMTNLDFPKLARREFNIGAVEYVNQLFMDKAKDQKYLNTLKDICDGEGVKSLMIMCDSEGALGDPDTNKRNTAVENHKKWADAAKFLGCHSIRVNAQTQNVGDYEEQQKRAADGLTKLSEYCQPLGLNVIVENHGGLSSHGKWLAGVMKMVGRDSVGTLPDFGNFKIDRKAGTEYDRYQGVEDLMPFAKGVSAKSEDFDEKGNEIHTDYRRMLKIVKNANYRGYVGIEYSGKKLSEKDGIRATMRLLERVRKEV
ncbi:MAG: xylose isomerase [Verrucomicrobiales bacterium]|nr:xylose isomerase [Verrucomicrobiales bacterium]|tara:strand:+ start:6370 stop:7293 length:924 start_codon:yes stop_codon:yes gene_type:complete